MLDRRRFLTLFAAAGAISATQGAVAQAPLPKVVVTKDPNCGCCGGWVDHMRAAGFPVDVVATPQVNRLKSRLGVPDDLASCHTAEVGGYVVSFAALSFLGVGTPIGYADWGQLLSFARDWITNLSTYWYIVLFPGLALVFFVMGWNLLGDALRDVLDPKMRGKI